MLESKLRSILGGLLTVFLTAFLFQGGVLAASVDVRATQAVAPPVGTSTDGSADAGGLTSGLTADPFPDRVRLDVFASTDLPRPDMPAAPAVSLDGTSEPPEVASETGFIHALFVDTRNVAFRWPSLTAMGAGSAGWQILLPSLPDAQLRHLFGTRMSPTVLMFASGLAGLLFLARCRPRRRGQLGLMT